MKTLLLTFTFTLLLLTLAQSCAQTPAPKNDYLLLVTDTITDQTAYINQQGDTIIPFGKYNHCFTDTFRTYAIVLSQRDGFSAIDRNGNFMYKVYAFDNGPDYYVEAMFRIVKNEKIGFADSATGKIVIEPQYECAYPFENGKAKVSVKCKQTPENEMVKWESENWIYIDKKGKIVK